METGNRGDPAAILRTPEGRGEATRNRELSILRTAFNLERKCSPPKVQSLPYFPLAGEANNARQGFLTGEQYGNPRDALPDYLKPLFVSACWTGAQKGELLSWTWDQFNLERAAATLQATGTKSGHARFVPIIDGDMKQWLEKAKASADNCPAVFHRDGTPINEFRTAWTPATKAAGVPELRFHDLRRTAVRNMRRAGVPQVARTWISVHSTDSASALGRISPLD